MASSNLGILERECSEEDRWVLFTVLLQVGPVGCVLRTVLLQARPMHSARVSLDHGVISTKTGGEQWKTFTTVGHYMTVNSSM